MKKIIILILFLVFTFQTAVFASTPITKSQLEMRRIQTRTFNTQNTTRVFKAAINTLQDNDFTILNIEDDVGFILAKKENKEKRIDKGKVAMQSSVLVLSIVTTVFGAPSPDNIIDSTRRINNEVAARTVVTFANINVEPFGTRTKVRITFLERELYNADGYSYVKSSPRRVRRITSENTYQEFFRQMDKNLFIENSGI